MLEMWKGYKTARKNNWNISCTLGKKGILFYIVMIKLMGNKLDTANERKITTEQKYSSASFV